MESGPKDNQALQFKELFFVSNMFSLLRLAAIPALWYYLAKPEQKSSYIALFILVLAGVTDWLDGFLARQLNQISRMGMILDPLADKILAGALVIMLIFTRDFPIWLAVLILGRDLLILAAASILLKGKNLVVSSTITGKYAFFFIVVLLACSVIRFKFGAQLATYISTALIAVSLFKYARTFSVIQKGERPAPFVDRPVYKAARVGLTVLVLVILLLQLYLSWE